MAISTRGVTLKIKEGAAYVKLVDIKDFPDLGATPELVETTTLSDSTQTFINGVKTLQALEFTANYSDADFTAVIEKADTQLDYELNFGEDGSEGKFQWSGMHTAWVVGGGTNVVVDMKISIAPSTKISKAAATPVE